MIQNTNHGIVFNNKKKVRTTDAHKSDEYPGSYTEVGVVIKVQSEASVWGWKCFVS